MSTATEGGGAGEETPPLPSTTLGRFVAAVTAVVGTSMFGWQTVLVDADATRARAECLSGVGPPIDMRAGTVDEESVAAVQRCLGTLDADLLRQMLIGLAVLAAVAAVVYLAAPWCECRLRGLRRLDRTPGTEALRSDLAGLVREAGLRRPPTFVVSRSARISGNTFGAGPIRYVRLDLGLVHAHRTAPHLFRAVVLHELAHVRNADVHLTRLTIAQAWAFPLAVLVPVTANYVGSVPARHLFDDAWRLAAFALIVQVSAWSVLRAREFAADARLTGDDSAAVRALLATDRMRAGPWARLGAAFRFHPLARARADALDRPGRRYAARPVEALGAGLAAGIAAPPLLDLMTNLPHTLPGPDPLTGSAFATGVLLAVPLALVTTGALWRSAWWARRTGAPAASGAVFGAALACGLLVGRRLAWSTAYTDDRRAWWVEVVLGLLWISGGALLGRWVAAGARAHLLRIPPSDASRTRLAWAGAALATMAVSAGYVAALLVLDAWSTDGELSMWRLVAAREGHPDTLTPLTLLDLLGFFFRIVAAQAPYLLVLPLAAALFPVLATRHANGRAVRLGLVGGAVGALVLPLVPLGAGVAARDPGLATATAALLVNSHTLLPVTFVELTVAVAAVSTQRLSLPHALLAALTAGLLMVPAILAAGTVLSCAADATGRCVPAADGIDAVRALTHALVVAPVAAALTAALGAAVAAGLAAAGRHRRWVVAAVAVLLASASAVAVARGRPAPAAPAGRDPCLLGVWRLSDGRYHLLVEADSPLGTLAGLTRDASLDLTSGPDTGFATAYRADGSATELYDLFVAGGTLNGHAVRSVHRGVVTYRWAADAGRYTQRDSVDTGDVVLRVDDREVDVTPTVEDTNGSYQCADDRLVIRQDNDDGSWGEEIFVRSRA
ncbi:M48 family metalloprotease [Micromonospora rubida]|uniref:M48 family metalloprotease n=1 Tax=Micromonospora rubida TaxID=2697657 RepID=UPI001377267B|nr:M48 family metalloprotease [Micromonospora rubida]NBE84090.1 M48 family metalloprotease [Micromonospora rubida]